MTPSSSPTILFTGLRAPRLEREQLRGVALHHHPTIRISYFAPTQFQNAGKLLSQNPCVVFLSRNGVIGLSEWANSEDATLDLDQTIIWAVGAATAQQVEMTLGHLAAQPQEQNALGLIQTFGTLAKRPVVLFTAEEPRPEFPAWLLQNGWEFEQFPVYRTEILENSDLRQRFQNNENESVVFTSPSTVKGFLLSIGHPDLTGLTSRWISIGPSTTNEIESAGGVVHWEADEPDVQQLLLNLIKEIS